MIELQRLYWRLICNDQHPYSMMLALSVLYDNDDNHDDDVDMLVVVVSLIEMVDELALDRWRSYDDEDSNEHDHRRKRYISVEPQQLSQILTSKWREKVN